MANTLIFFAEKMWVAFALTFCIKNISVFENTLVTIVNKFVINELIKLTMLWTTEPRRFSFLLRTCWWSVGFTKSVIDYEILPTLTYEKSNQAGMRKEFSEKTPNKLPTPSCKTPDLNRLD